MVTPNGRALCSACCADVTLSKPQSPVTDAVTNVVLSFELIEQPSRSAYHPYDILLGTEDVKSQPQSDSMSLTYNI